MNVSRETADQETQEKLEIYHAALMKWQKAINLVSPATLDLAWDRHFEDSMQLVVLIPDNAKTLFDLGSGAGFPGLVLALLRPELNVHLIESDQKKCEFLRHVVRETETNIQVHNQRIETAEIKDVPDIITARALSDLSSLLGYCHRWAEQNADLTMLFPKGQKAEQEVNAARDHYDFAVESLPSRTDPSAHILKIIDLKAR